LRRRVDDRLAAGDHHGAWAEMSAAISTEPTTATCHVVAEALDRLDPRAAGLTEIRVAWLANFTVEPLATVLAARAVPSGIAVHRYTAPIDRWMQEILDADSGLRRASADVVVMALTLEALAPALTAEFLSLGQEHIDDLIDNTAATIAASLEGLRSWTPAKVLLHSFPLPVHPALGMIDGARADGQTAAFQRLNLRLQSLADAQPDVFVVDLDRLVRTIGDHAWRDARMEIVGGFPFTMTAVHAIAEEHLRYVRAFCGRTRKVLVVDADDTLWGGIVGEVGAAGIAIGDGYPGACFAAFQRALLELRRRGVLLALNSANNPTDVDDVLGAHPRMLLRRDDFAAVRVNWNDKAANLVSIADELGIGLDSVVFMDDSAAECERIRTALPEVLSIHLGGDPSRHADLVRGLGVFDTLSYGSDDRQRAARYGQESARRQLRRELPSLDAFYGSLEMELGVERVSPMTIARAAELSQRTNQFNLAPRRFTRDELEAALSAPGTEGYIFGLRDRFGDHGLIALAIVEGVADTVQVSALLVSCRVLKRTVEDAVLAFLSARACDRGATHIEGLFRPSAKNQAAATFYRDHGFTLASCGPDGTEVYRRAAHPPIAATRFIKLGMLAANRA
jgi:FkbH-like protein